MAEKPKKPPKAVNKLINKHAKMKPEKPPRTHSKPAPTNVLSLIAQALNRKKGGK
jgi:hypothetical protein